MTSEDVGSTERGLTEMVKALLASQERREEERCRREEAMLEAQQRREEVMAGEQRKREERMREFQAQNEMLRNLMEKVHGKDEGPYRRGPDSLKLAKLAESDDIEVYLTTFERLMAAYEIDASRWAFLLAPQLTGKAQQAYAAMSESDSSKYEEVKTAILRRYDINEETYRQRFRSAKQKGGETPIELTTRLQDLADKWLKECDSKEKVVDVIIREQFLNTLPEDVRVWVKERQPATSKEAGRLAEDYLQARKATGRLESNGRMDKRPGPPGGPAVGPRQCLGCGQLGHWIRECPKKAMPLAGGPPREHSLRKERQPREALRCFNCGKRGHLAMKCPDRALFCDSSRSCLGRGVSRQEQGTSRRGLVEGRYVTDILLDTGCSRTLVHRDLVAPGSMLEGEAVTIRCAHGDVVLYALAEVGVEVDGKVIKVDAAVSDTLPVSVLLGTDVPELSELLKGMTMEPVQSGDALVVMTRARAKQQECEEAIQKEREQLSGARPHALEELGNNDAEEVEESHGGQQDPATVQEQATPLLQSDEGLQETSEEEIWEEPEVVPGSNFDEDIFVEARERAELTRSQKRAGQCQHREQSGNQEEVSHTQHPLDLTMEELRKLQVEDVSLAGARRVAAGQPCLAVGKGFFERDGLLYRRWTPPGRDESMEVEQLVLPKQCRKTVLQLAHEIPLAGHMGKGKTTQRILQRFYWPTVYQDVAEFCRSCERCQKCPHRRVQKAHLIPLPIISEPFQRIALDIVGPLPRSRSGNRYVLVICDYAARFPEAVPLRSIEAERIAEELIKLFARVGIPGEILTDQGSNFTSQLLTEIYRLLHVHPIRTSPYHPQTDGLVERFNQTLKTMLRKTAVEEGKDWDKLLPYLLFEYREVPQDSTGFSPYELLYGRSV